MIDFSKITDPYERKARLYPALICLFPVMVSISLSFPKVYSTLSGFVALAAAIGVMQLMAHLARDRGKHLEQTLFEAWGGMPSVVILRYRDKTIPGPAKTKYHAVLAKKSNIVAPTELFEKENPKEADDIYESWSDFLRGKTRDGKKYALVFKENINYGFRRNLLGIKRFCILSALISFVILLFPSLKSLMLSEIQIATGTLLIIYTMIFIFVVSDRWVKTVANAYSKNLIEAINT